jgi:hypothetical protein
MVQLGFAHHSSQSEQQAVMVLVGVIDKLRIGDQHTKNGAST